jgi:hypothetical protein
LVALMRCGEDFEFDAFSYFSSSQVKAINHTVENSLYRRNI